MTSLFGKIVDKITEVKDSVKETANNLVMAASDKLGFKQPPATDHFRIDGTLSPSEFERAGDKLVQSNGWVWCKSQNANRSKFLDKENKQFLMLTGVKCEERVSSLTPKQE